MSFTISELLECWKNSLHPCKVLSGMIPTVAEAYKVKPIAKGAMLPCPGFVTAVAYTTPTKQTQKISYVFKFSLKVSEREKGLIVRRDPTKLTFKITSDDEGSLSYMGEMTHLEPLCKGYISLIYISGRCILSFLVILTCECEGHQAFPPEKLNLADFDPCQVCKAAGAPAISRGHPRHQSTLHT